MIMFSARRIYTSRNSFRLLNQQENIYMLYASTQVEILLGYLTIKKGEKEHGSTQVEILLGYLTIPQHFFHIESTQVEILLGYLTKKFRNWLFDLHK